MAHPCNRVLVVDDDEDTRDSIAMLLEGEGVEVVAGAPPDALEVLRRGFRPDVIVVDLVMPQMSGHAFRERLRLDPALASIPVVLCTASPRLARDVTDAFDAVIAKPFDADVFFAALADFCLERA